MYLIWLIDSRLTILSSLFIIVEWALINYKVTSKIDLIILIINTFIFNDIYWYYYFIFE